MGEAALHGAWRLSTRQPLPGFIATIAGGSFGLSRSSSWPAARSPCSRRSTIDPRQPEFR